MSIQAGNPFAELTNELLEVVRTEVSLSALHAVNEYTAAELHAWVSAIVPEVYQPAGFTADDAALLVAQRPFEQLDEIAAVEGVGVAKLGDLVYAAAAAEAAAPEQVLVEEVYELSALGDVAFATELRVPIPALAAEARIEAKRAYITLASKPQTVELRPLVHQRQLEDSWAELDLPRRARIWYLAAAGALAARARTTGSLVLFPRLGDEFLENPVLEIEPTSSLVDVPPVSTQTKDHEFYTFPEIEGEQFMLRIGIPPTESNPNENWPQDYRFHAATGDVLLYGPSYPTEVEVRFGGTEIAWTRGGELLDSARSRDVVDALQRALDALDEVADEDAASAAQELLLTATSKTPGSMYLGFEADVEAAIDRFADDKTNHTMTFTRALHSGEVGLRLPGAGEPDVATIEVEGHLSNCVIKQEIGAADAPTGDNKIGVRLTPALMYSQPFEVQEAFELSAIDIRLANASPDTRLVVEVVSADAKIEAALTTPALGRQAVWQFLHFDTTLAVEPETTYTLRVWVSTGEVVWLCGAGESRRYLSRHQGDGPAARVDDVQDKSPLLGEVRLRTDIPLDEPRLELTLSPGETPILLRDIEVFDDGTFQARAEMSAALADIDSTDARLRVQAHSEGTVTFKNPAIRYRLHIKVEK